MKITIPYPPTANLYWRHARGRTFLSAAAKAFKTEVRKRLEAARVKPQEGPLALHVHVYRPRKVGDLDNTLKVLGDALNGAAWHDDKQVVEIHAYRHDDKANPRAEVEVVPAMLNNALQPWEPTPVPLGTLRGKRAIVAELNRRDAARPRKGDAAKAREEGRKSIAREILDEIEEGHRKEAKRLGITVPDYTPPRSTPVDAAKEAEVFAPGARLAPVVSGEGCGNCEGVNPESCPDRANH